MFQFEVIHQSKRSQARVGRIHTAHGVIDTPNFVGVGTNGSIKCLDSKLVDDLDLQLMFCNTYHLLLQPGPQVVEKAGGLHKFINRNKPIITDSGGFQVFSLAYGSVADELKSKGCKKNANAVVKVNEAGATFRSYRDGALIKLTPEYSVEVQKALGADIIIPLDELPPYHISAKKLQESLERTHRWQKRSLAVHLEDKRHQAMYAVIHGGVNQKMRVQSCQELTQLEFDGFSIGGSLGKNTDDIIKVLEYTMPNLPTTHPVHLLGIGDISSMSASIPYGVDTFDSSYPTRAARHGVALVKNGKMKLTRKCVSQFYEPIEEGCKCYTCQHYTVAYLHHLFKAHEMTALTLTSLHNLYIMVQWMRNIREEILQDKV